MTLQLVTKSEQHRDLNFHSPEDPVAFWVNTDPEQRSNLHRRIMHQPVQWMPIAANSAGLVQCLDQQPPVVVIDGTLNVEHAITWAAELFHKRQGDTSVVLLGFETEKQCSELVFRGLPVGIHDVVPLHSPACFTQRLAIALQLSSARSENQRLAHEVQNLERMNHLKDEFIGTVVHELRAPIANMKLAGQLVETQIQQVQLALGEDLQSDSFGKALLYLQTLKRECERETVLINNLLDLQKLESGAYTLEAQPIEVAQWLAEVVEPFYLRVQTRQIGLELKLPDPLPLLVSSAVSLERVLNELLHNACKYTPPGETIQLSAHACSPDMLELRVTNTGVEIPGVEQPRVFEKFYRVPRSDRWKQGGTGLGLTLVKQLVARLGGQIAIKSGGGETQFILQLPFQNPQVPVTDEA